MCGIGGFLQSKPLREAEGRAVLSRMAQALWHRGPDAGGTWQAPEAGVGLCHRRLAVLELSAAGAQPMRSGSGRFVLVYNGEIYNHAALRRELRARGAVFRGGSDTEVLLEGFGHFGIEATLRRCRGMFAFALWDEQERVLTLARDRFGEKPLYYLTGPGQLVFASELKGLREHPACRAEVDRDALAALLRHDYIPSPRCIWRGVAKLRPGHLLEVRLLAGQLRTAERRWHQEPESAEAPLSDPQEALEAVRAALEESIRLQMVADVPVGAFLSGGIDSSLVVALMQQASSRPVRSFSLGFEDPALDESPHARAVAQHLGTQHTERIVTAADALAVIPRLPDLYDEPFADSSQIPTALVCALARREVTVALSGDGGDELFAGYPRYLEVRDRWARLTHSPRALRYAAGQLVRVAPGWMLELAARALTQGGRARVPERMRERASGLACRSAAELYAVQTGFWQSPQPVLGAGRNPERLDGAARAPAGLRLDPVRQMQCLDLHGYLPDDILVKVDRAAMAVSLETRVPLLDAQLARVAARIPTAVHLRDGRGKWILRTLLSRYVPAALTERPKSGFAVPLAAWLRGPLREWAGALIDPARLRRETYLDPDPIARRWRQHLDGRFDWSAHLWGVLMFQAWLEHSVVRAPAQLEAPALDFTHGGSAASCAAT